jgi:serine/threonine protein kinase
MPISVAFAARQIGDWGSARAVALHTGGMRTMTHGVGTACWLAPEVIRHAKGSWQSDVYAFGILLWELATREEVHSNLTAAQIIARVANEGLRPAVPRGCPWREVMVHCWHEDPEARPTFTEVSLRA